MTGLDDKLKAVVSQIKESLNEAYDVREERFKTFERESADARIAAVDGSSKVVLDAGSYIIGIYRAGYVVYQNRELVGKEIKPLEIELISKSCREELYREFLSKVSEEEPSIFSVELSNVLGRIRDFEELNIISELIDDLDRDDIILRDGSLRAGYKHLDAPLKEITEKAGEKGVHLIGISKRSSYNIKDAPLIPIIKKSGEKLFPRECWYYPVAEQLKEHQYGKIYVVRFNPLSSYAFRTDVNLPESERPENIFGKISDYCNDASYPGYPFPLAMVHNEVVIDKNFSRDIRYRLQSIALSEDVSMKDWEDLFQDFHEILDIGV